MGRPHPGRDAEASSHGNDDVDEVESHEKRCPVGFHGVFGGSLVLGVVVEQDHADRGCDAHGCDVDEDDPPDVNEEGEEPPSFGDCARLVGLLLHLLGGLREVWGKSRGEDAEDAAKGVGDEVVDVSDAVLAVGYEPVSGVLGELDD